METNKIIELPPSKKGFLWIQNEPKKIGKFYLGTRVCDNCGKTKDTYGGYSCSKGHFICHSCASGHIHCPLCGHTLR
jgi:hypothetical protein